MPFSFDKMHCFHFRIVKIDISTAVPMEFCWYIWLLFSLEHHYNIVTPKGADVKKLDKLTQ